MPYRTAHWWIVGLMAIVAVAFWPDYFGVLREAPWAFHLHGITASLWIMLLGLQSWSASTRRFAQHRLFGRASLGLFPIFVAGGFGVLHSMAAATPTSPFYRLHGPGLGLIDMLAVGSVAWLYFHALRERRNVQRHARFMLATPLLLVSPAVGRISAAFIPGLTVRGPQDFHLFGASVHVGNLVALIAAIWLYRAMPRHGLPFLVCAVVIIVQSIGFALAPDAMFWRDAFIALGQLPAAPIVLAGLAVGVAVTWGGWVAGQRRPRAAPAAA